MSASAGSGAPPSELGQGGGSGTEDAGRGQDASATLDLGRDIAGVLDALLALDRESGAGPSGRDRIAREAVVAYARLVARDMALSGRPALELERALLKAEPSALGVDDPAGDALLEALESAFGGT